MPASNVTNTIPLFIGQYCYDTLLPSGDAGISPSGNFTNSIGNTTSMFSYINSNPRDSLTDTTFLKTAENNTPTPIDDIYFLDLYSNSVKKFNSATGVITNIKTYDIAYTLSSVAYNMVDNLVYVGYSTGGNGIIDRINMDTGVVDQFGLGAGIIPFSMIVHYSANKKLYFTVSDGFAQGIYTLIDWYEAINYSLYGTAQFVIDFGGAPNLTFGVMMEDLAHHTVYFIVRQSIPSGDVVFYKTYLYPIFFNTAVGTPTILNNAAFLEGDIGVKTIFFSASNLMSRYTYEPSVSPIAPVFDNAYLINPNGPNAGKIRVDNITNKVHYLFNGGLYNAFPIVGAVQWSGAKTIDTSGSYYITDFYFTRDVYKQSSDFQLTQPKATFGTNNGNVFLTDAYITIKAQDSSNVTFVNTKVISNSKQTLLLYPKSVISGIIIAGLGQGLADWGSWASGAYRLGSSPDVPIIPSGLNAQDIALSGKMTISSTHNTRNDWNAATLRINSYSIATSSSNVRFDIYSAQVTLSCSGLFPPLPHWTGVFPLYCKGAGVISKTMTLFTIAGTVVAGRDLYIHGKTAVSGVCSLYERGSLPVTGNTTLFIHGITSKTTTMPIFMQVKTAVKFSGHATLFEMGSSKSGQFKVFPLYIPANPASGGFNSNMNVVMRGVGSFVRTSSMNLFLKRDPFTGNPLKTATLFVKNERSGIANTVSMFMNSPSGTPGSVPWSSTMNMFIARANTPMLKVTTLFVNGPKNVINTATIYMNCKPNATGIPPLYVKGKGVTTGTPKLYTHGF